MCIIYACFDCHSLVSLEGHAIIKFELLLIQITNYLLRVRDATYCRALADLSKLPQLQHTHSVYYCAILRTPVARQLVCLLSNLAVVS